jgi:hypothetical protein
VVPKRRPQDDQNDSSLTPTHFERCLYLLAEADRVIDRTAADWTQAETGAVGVRLAAIAQRLARAATRLH